MGSGALMGAGRGGECRRGEGEGGEAARTAARRELRCAHTPRSRPKSTTTHIQHPAPHTPPTPQTSTEERIEAWKSEAPMGRPAHPAEIAPCYVFLACEVIDDDEFGGGGRGWMGCVDERGGGGDGS